MPCRTISRRVCKAAGGTEEQGGGMTDPQWVTTLRRQAIRDWANQLLDGQFANWQTERSDRTNVATREFVELLCMVARRPLPPRQTAGAEDGINDHD